MEGKAAGELRGRRDDLRKLLEACFGPLPELLTQQIEALDDPNRRTAALLQVVHIASLAELKL